MADETDDELLGRLTGHAFATVSEPLRANLWAYYRDVASLPTGTDAERKRSATVRQQLARLGAADTLLFRATIVAATPMPVPS